MIFDPYTLTCGPGMGMFGDAENALCHFSVFAYPNNPFEIRFKNFDRVIGQGDRSRNPQNMTNANFLKFARPL
jgi:hypothetical protein